MTNLKMHLTMSEASALLGMTEADIRVLVSGGILQPIGYSRLDEYGKKLLHLRQSLTFNRDDILKQWEIYQKSSYDTAKKLDIIIQSLDEIRARMERIEKKVAASEYIGTEQLAQSLGIHPVTIRKKLRKISDTEAILELNGYRPIKMFKIGAHWKAKM